MVNAAHGILIATTEIKKETHKNKTLFYQFWTKLILDYSNQNQHATMWMGNPQINQWNNRSQTLG